MSVYWIFLIPAFLLVFGCSSEEKYDLNTAKGAYLQAKEYDDDELYEEALRQYADVKNRHPYSKYATMAKLAMADIHYKRESYVEAQHSYQNFRELHPTHEKRAYVTYKLAMSFYKYLPSSVDRDLSQAKFAIQFFDEVIQSHAESEYVKDAITNRRKTQEMLAGKVYYIAEFYFI